MVFHSLHWGGVCPGTVQLAQGHTGWLSSLEAQWGNQTPNLWLCSRILKLLDNPASWSALKPSTLFVSDPQRVSLLASTLRLLSHSSNGMPAQTYLKKCGFLRNRRSYFAVTKTLGSSSSDLPAVSEYNSPGVQAR